MPVDFNLLKYRLDVAVKYMYVEAYCNGGNPLISDIYDAMVYSTTHGMVMERDHCKTVNTLEAYRSKFNHLIDEVKDNGFNFPENVEEIGAHRIALLLYFGYYKSDHVNHQEADHAIHSFFREAMNCGLIYDDTCLLRNCFPKEYLEIIRDYWDTRFHIIVTDGKPECNPFYLTRVYRCCYQCKAALRKELIKCYWCMKNEQ